MGMGSVGGGKGRRGLVSEINVTPLVDVMLVLLIIFMVTSPMMTQGMDVDLPKTTNKALRQDDEPLVITLNKKGEIYLDKIKVNSALLTQQLSGMPEERKKKPIYLRADEQVSYGLVVELMANIKLAGFDKLGMITLPVDSAK